MSSHPHRGFIPAALALAAALALVFRPAAASSLPDAGLHQPRQAAVTVTPMPVFAVVTVTPGVDGAVVHQVQPGQTLFGIADAYGISFADLAALNNLASPYTIFPGELLIIRLGATATITSPASPTPRPSLTPVPTRRPPTALPTPASSPTPAPTRTSTPWLRMPYIEVDSHRLGIFIIATCSLGLLLVLSTFFRRR